jgi:Tol biopolymer transport system component
VGFKADRPNLLELDLSNGEEATVFEPPDNAWLSEVAASPGGSQLLLAYGPPPDAGQVQFGFTDLYVMPADGSAEPQPLLSRADPSETYFNISWPVEEWIYYAHFAPSADEEGIVTYFSQVERMQVASGQVEVLADSAAWPRVSRDGSLLAYVTDENEFMLTGADGANPQSLLDSALFTAIDAPLFSPDNSLICFSAVEASTALSPGFWDWLLGVKVASAHGVPSDWYCRPLDGSGEPKQITHLNAIGLYGDFDISGQHWAFVSSEGVNMMNSDGSDLRRLKDIPTTGSVDWVP